MIKLIKSLIPFSFKRSFKDKLGVPSLHWSLQNLKQKGFKPTHVLDVGAYEGNWTIDFLEVFANANVLMIEGQKSKANKLKEVENKFPKVKFSINLLSSENGKSVSFYENETASHIDMNATGIDNLSNTNIIKTKTLDTVITESNFLFPQLIKLDVQGHELEVLKGGAQALAKADFCLLEVSLLDLGDNAPLFFEIQAYMDAQGFQAYDICQFMRRQFDKALYQIDLIFIKKDSLLISEKRWN